MSIEFWVTASSTTPSLSVKLVSCDGIRAPSSEIVSIFHKQQNFLKFSAYLIGKFDRMNLNSYLAALEFSCLGTSCLKLVCLHTLVSSEGHWSKGTYFFTKAATDEEPCDLERLLGKIHHLNKGELLTTLMWLMWKLESHLPELKLLAFSSQGRSWSKSERKARKWFQTCFAHNMNYCTASLLARFQINAAP